MDDGRGGGSFREPEVDRSSGEGNRPSSSFELGDPVRDTSEIYEIKQIKNPKIGDSNSAS